MHPNSSMYLEVCCAGGAPEGIGRMSQECILGNEIADHVCKWI